jgi:hypothetical protein
MDWKIALSLTVPALVAIAGWLVGHYFNSKRDAANRRKEQVTKFLLDAYRKMEKSASARKPELTWDDMESAIADIQLLGSPEQVNLAVDFARQMAAKNVAHPQPLLKSLRNSLRAELNLPPLESEITHLRFDAVSSNENIERLSKNGPDRNLRP